jgi:hypothetical protein
MLGNLSTSQCRVRILFKMSADSFTVYTRVLLLNTFYYVFSFRNTLVSSRPKERLLYCYCSILFRFNTSLILDWIVFEHLPRHSVIRINDDVTFKTVSSCFRISSHDDHTFKFSVSLRTSFGLSVLQSALVEELHSRGGAVLPALLVYIVVYK